MDDGTPIKSPKEILICKRAVLDNKLVMLLRRNGKEDDVFLGDFLASMIFDIEQCERDISQVILLSKIEERIERESERRYQNHLKMYYDRLRDVSKRNGSIDR